MRLSWPDFCRHYFYQLLLPRIQLQCTRTNAAWAIQRSGVPGAKRSKKTPAFAVMQRVRVADMLRPPTPTPITPAAPTPRTLSPAVQTINTESNLGHLIEGIYTSCSRPKIIRSGPVFLFDFYCSTDFVRVSLRNHLKGFLRETLTPSSLR